MSNFIVVFTRFTDVSFLFIITCKSIETSLNAPSACILLLLLLLLLSLLSLLF